MNVTANKNSKFLNIQQKTYIQWNELDYGGSLVSLEITIMNPNMSLKLNLWLNLMLDLK